MNVLINFGPYILSVGLAAAIFIFVLLQVRSLKSIITRLEDSLSDMEAKTAAREDALREELRKTGEEKDLKISQLRDDLRAALNSFLESTGKKLAESAAAQKNQIDVLAARINSLGSQIAQKAEPRREPPAAQAQKEAPPQAVPPKAEPPRTEPPRAEPPKATPANGVTAAHEKARRLARLIVSDILLYNQAAVEEGVRNNTLAQVLAHDIQEARALYMQRVPEEIRKGTTYLEEAFSELIVRKKKELGLA